MTAYAQRQTGTAAAVLIVAGGAWMVVVLQSHGMQSAAGTMGYGLAGFVVFWTVMMAAMMLPSLSLVASAYSALLPGRAAAPVAGLLTGYLLAWAGVGLLAFAVADLAGRLAEGHAQAAARAGAAVLLAAGLYQLSPLKHRCLTHCRSPLPSLVRLAGSSGRLRHVRAGAAHGGYCVGCCAGLMAALIALGIMNLWWMVALAAVIALEKNWAHGRGLATATAAALVVLGVAALLDASIVPGFQPMPMGSM